MWKIILLAVVIIGIAIAALAIKLLVKKNGEFKKSCSSVDPKTGNRIGCTCDRGELDSSCANKS